MCAEHHLASEEEEDASISEREANKVPLSHRIDGGGLKTGLFSPIAAEISDIVAFQCMQC